MLPTQQVQYQEQYNKLVEQLAGIFGFKFANIQGLLAARGAFDRSRDIISQKQAKSIN